jgi:hypothetical protein
MKQIVGCLCYKSPISWWIFRSLGVLLYGGGFSAWREVISSRNRLICFWCHLYPYVLFILLGQYNS